MENNYKKLLCAISVITLVVIIIQLNDAFSLSPEPNNNTIVEDNTDPVTNFEIDKQTQTNSIKINNNYCVTVGSKVDSTRKITN